MRSREITHALMFCSCGSRRSRTSLSASSSSVSPCSAAPALATKRRARAQATCDTAYDAPRDECGLGWGLRKKAPAAKVEIRAETAWEISAESMKPAESMKQKHNAVKTEGSLERILKLIHSEIAALHVRT
eukprot:3797358-Pleurochrysis_carterae.AAC.2